jgi:hypothetical protein
MIKPLESNLDPCLDNPLMAQSDEDRRVAGWTVDKFKNGALSALPPFDAKQSFAI